MMMSCFYDVLLYCAEEDLSREREDHDEDSESEEDDEEQTAFYDDDSTPVETPYERNITEELGQVWLIFSSELTLHAFYFSLKIISALLEVHYAVILIPDEIFYLNKHFTKASQK